MLLEELISFIGSECAKTDSEAFQKFPWLVDTSIKPPANSDEALASSISSGDMVPCETVVDGIIRSSLLLAAEASICSTNIIEREAIRLICKFSGLLGPFLKSGLYNSEKLRAAIRDECSDSEVSLLLEKCIEFLEDALNDISEKQEILERYFKFLSLVIDAKFLQWYVKSGAMGSPLAKVTALVNRYRRALFNDQQARSKSEGSQIETALKRKTDPTPDGRLFIHQLRC